MSRHTHNGGGHSMLSLDGDETTDRPVANVFNSAYVTKKRTDDYNLKPFENQFVDKNAPSLQYFSAGTKVYDSHGIMRKPTDLSSDTWSSPMLQETNLQETPGKRSRLKKKIGWLFRKKRGNVNSADFKTESSNQTTEARGLPAVSVQMNESSPGKSSSKKKSHFGRCLPFKSSNRAERRQVLNSDESSDLGTTQLVSDEEDSFILSEEFFGSKNRLAHDKPMVQNKFTEPERIPYEFPGLLDSCGSSRSESLSPRPKSSKKSKRSSKNKERILHVSDGGSMHDQHVIKVSPATNVKKSHRRKSRKHKMDHFSESVLPPQRKNTLDIPCPDSLKDKQCYPKSQQLASFPSNVFDDQQTMSQQFLKFPTRVFNDQPSPRMLYDDPTTSQQLMKFPSQIYNDTNSPRFFNGPNSPRIFNGTNSPRYFNGPNSPRYFNGPNSPRVSFEDPSSAGVSFEELPPSQNLMSFPSRVFSDFPGVSFEDGEVTPQFISFPTRFYASKEGVEEEEEEEEEEPEILKSMHLEAAAAQATRNKQMLQKSAGMEIEEMRTKITLKPTPVSIASEKNFGFSAQGRPEQVTKNKHNARNFSFSELMTVDQAKLLDEFARGQAKTKDDNSTKAKEVERHVNGIVMGRPQNMFVRVNASQTPKNNVIRTVPLTKYRGHSPSNCVKADEFHMKQIVSMSVQKTAKEHNAVQKFHSTLSPSRRQTMYADSEKCQGQEHFVQCLAMSPKLNAENNPFPCF